MLMQKVFFELNIFNLLIWNIRLCVKHNLPSRPSFLPLAKQLLHADFLHEANKMQ